MDPELARVILGLFSVVNTALLVWQAIRLHAVHQAVNGARDAAVESAHIHGVVEGAEAMQSSVGRFPTDRPPST